MDRVIFYKQWELGGIMSSKSSILLDMIETIHQKSKHINTGSVKVYQDNKLLMRLINNDIEKESLYTIEARAKITCIKQIMKESRIQFKLI